MVISVFYGSMVLAEEKVYGETSMQGCLNDLLEIVSTRRYFYVLILQETGIGSRCIIVSSNGAVLKKWIEKKGTEFFKEIRPFIVEAKLSQEDFLKHLISCGVKKKFAEQEMARMTIKEIPELDKFGVETENDLMHKYFDYNEKYKQWVMKANGTLKTPYDPSLISKLIDLGYIVGMGDAVPVVWAEKGVTH